MNQCDEKHRSPTPKHAATAGIWRHEREGISYPSRDMLQGPDSVPSIPLRLAPLPELEKFEQPVIAHKEVNYVGEPIALVIADSLAQAEDALEAIELDIEPLPAMADRHGGKLAIKYTATKGDALAVKAPYVRRERFAVQRHTAVCMEPRGLLASWDGARAKLTVSGAKGAGEGGIVPVGGVVANAVANALAPLDVEPRSLPRSPPKVWELISRPSRRP